MRVSGIRRRLRPRTSNASDQRGDELRIGVDRALRPHPLHQVDFQQDAFSGEEIFQRVAAGIQHLQRFDYRPLGTGIIIASGDGDRKSQERSPVMRLLA